MKIVVRGTNWIGDAVMTIPALRRLRALFPEAHIALHTRSWAEGIFRDADFLDEILTFDKTSSTLADIRKESRRLREMAFDMAILLPNSFESALVARLARIPTRLGYAKEGRGFLLTSAVTIPEWKNTRHEVFYYLKLIDTLAGPANFEAPPSLTLPISDERRGEAKDILADAGVDTTKPVVALGVGSTNSRAKRWPGENYAELNDRLAGVIDASVVLVGGPDEIDISQKVSDMAKIKPVVLTGKTDLAQAAALLSEIDLLISNDMGLAHIAPAVGTKTLVIFGPTNPETTRPFSEDAVVIKEPVDCAPCMLRDCPIDHRCMTRVTVGRVFDKAVKFLDD